MCRNGGLPGSPASKRHIVLWTTVMKASVDSLAKGRTQPDSFYDTGRRGVTRRDVLGQRSAPCPPRCPQIVLGVADRA